MLAVNISIGHQHDLVVTQLLNVELVVDAGAQGGNDCLDLVILQHLIHARLLDVQDLAAQRQDGLVHGIATGLCGTTCGIALHNVQLTELRVAGTAVRQLARQATDVGGRLAAHHVARLAGSIACMRGGHCLFDDGLRLGRVGIQPIRQVFIHCPLHEALDLGVSELGLRLTFELRVTDAHGNDGRQALTHVIAAELWILGLQQLVVAGVAVHQGGQRRTEAFLVRATFEGIDGVRKGVNGLAKATVPLQCDLYLVIFLGHVEGDDGRVDRGALAVDVGDVVLKTLRVVEYARARALFLLRLSGLFLRGLRSCRILGCALQLLVVLEVLALIDQLDGQTLVQESHLLQALCHRVEVKLDGLKDLRVRPKTLCRAGSAGLLDLLQLLGHRHLEVLTPQVPIALNLSFHAGGQGVNHRNAHAVQTTGYCVGVRVELTAGVQLRHDNLHGRRASRVILHRDATTVIDNLHATVGQQRNADLLGVARHSLINRVVHNFPHQVVQAALTGGSDVHTWTLADSLQAFQDRNRARAVVALLLWFSHGGSNSFSRAPK